MRREKKTTTTTLEIVKEFKMVKEMNRICASAATITATTTTTI